MKVSLYGLFPPNIGGVSIHIKRLAERMKSDGCLNRVYVNNYGLFDTYKYPEYCIDVSQMRRFNFLNKIKWIRKIVKTDGADLFHIHGSLYWDFILVFLLIKRYNKTVIFTVHDQMQLNKNSLSVFLCKTLYSIFSKDSIHFIAVNKCIKGQLLAIGIKDDSIDIIPAFIKEDNCELLDPELYNVIADETVTLLLYAPALKTVDDYELYGIFSALSSYSILLKKTLKKVKLLICVPNGIDYDIFNGILEKNEIPRHSYYLFTRPVSNMSHLLRLVDIYIRPTLSDGDSVLIREALAANCLVLASDVVPRPTGSFIFKSLDIFDFADKLAYIVSNIHMLKDEHLCIDDFYQDICCLYKKIIR